MKIAVATTTTTCRKMIHDMSDLNRSTLLFLGNEVADAAHGMDLNLGAAVGELFAKAMNVNFDGIRCDFVGESEKLILNQPFRNDTALPSHQKLEHRGFARGKDLRLIVDVGLSALGVEYEIGDVQG